MISSSKPEIPTLTEEQLQDLIFADGIRGWLEAGLPVESDASR